MYLCFLYLLNCRYITDSFYKRCWIILTIPELLSQLFLSKYYCFLIYTYDWKKSRYFLNCFSLNYNVRPYLFLFIYWKVPMWNFISIRQVTLHFSTLVPIPSSVCYTSLYSNPLVPSYIIPFTWTLCLSSLTSSMKHPWLSPHTLFSFPWTPCVIF